MLVAALLGVLSFAGAPKTGEPLSLTFEKYRLGNGLTVILHPDRAQPLVGVSVWYDVGAMHERPGRSGFAHLFEHMTFQSTAHVPEDAFMRILREAGATQINGVTTVDHTKYFETVPSHELELALWLESERMGFLLPALTSESLENQKAVVKAERLQMVRDRPYGLLNQLIERSIYSKTHPMYYGVIGRPEDLEQATLAEVREFYSTFYTPANATLTLAGDFELEAAKNLVAKYFNSLPSRPKPQRPKVGPPRVHTETLEAVEPIGRRARLTMAWQGPPAFTPQAFDLLVFAHILESRSLSRAGLVNLAGRSIHDLSAELEQDRLGSQLVIHATLAPEEILHRLVHRFESVLRSYRAYELDPTIVDAAKHELEAQLVEPLQEVGGPSGRSNMLQFAHHYLGDPSKLTWMIQQVRAPTARSIGSAIRLYLNGTQLVILAEPAMGRMVPNRPKDQN